MKKDKKYFMDKLSCGISRVKRDNTIEELTGPVTTFVSYGEMMHGSLEELLSCKSKQLPIWKIYYIQITKQF